MTVEEFRERCKELRTELKCGKITKLEYAHAISDLKYEYRTERKA